MLVRLVVSAVLSTFFLAVGSIKVFGWHEKVLEVQLRMFRKYGLNRAVMMLVGVGELIGAVCLWFPGSVLGPLGALLLLATSLGALGCHLLFDTWRDGIPAIATAILSAFALWLGRAPLVEWARMIDLFA